jgi:hypothetical protein
MSLINYSKYKYIPDEMDEKVFLSKFVVRNDEFEEIFEEIQNSDYQVPNQHYILIGQRGQGKTTLLRKIMLEVQRGIQLSSFLLPVKFAEEQYQIRSLCRLWEEVADYLQSIYEEEFTSILDDMESHIEEDDYALKCFSYLEQTLKSKNKKLLLLIDNIDELLGKLKEKEQRQLREILLSSSSFRIIGGSTKMLEQHFDYEKPFYEFFKIVKLSGLDPKETFDFLRAISDDNQKEKIESVIQNTPQRIETIRRLTGGVPRTMVMLVDIIADEGGNAFEDLLKILDEATPLYKHRMDDLPPVLQEIVHTIAINWDGMATKEIAKKTRLESKVVSAQLKQLEKYAIVESEAVGRNKIYKIQERFFNIWYLMRFGRKKDRQKVEWLVKFLVSWCSKDELNNRGQKLIDAVNNGMVNESYAYYMCEALGYAGLDEKIEHDMKESTRGYLLSRNSSLSKELSKSDKELKNKLLKILGITQLKSNVDLTAYICILEAKNLEELMPIVIERYNKNKNIDSMYNLAFVLLWSEKFINSYVNFFEFLDDELTFIEFAQRNKLEHLSGYAFDYLNVLISKNQYHKAKEFLELSKYQLKDRYKPIWFALMTLMQEEFPNEIKKMGSDLQESVDDILKEIALMKEKYQK